MSRVYSGIRAATFAGGVQRTTKEGRNEVRPQDKTGDPQRCPCHPIHMNGFPLATRLATTWWPELAAS